MIFDESTLEAYRSVKAPDSLREKILSLEPKKDKEKNKVISFKSLRTASLTAAACLILVAGSWGLLGGGVSVEAQNRNAGISLARELGPREIEIEISQRGFCKVSVSCGEISVGDKCGEEFFVFGRETLKWSVADEYASDALLTVSRYGKETSYVIVENADSGEFEICPAE